MAEVFLLDLMENRRPSQELQFPFLGRQICRLHRRLDHLLTVVAESCSRYDDSFHDNRILLAASQNSEFFPSLVRSRGNKASHSHGTPATNILRKDQGEQNLTGSLSKNPPEVHQNGSVLEGNLSSAFKSNKNRSWKQQNGLEMLPLWEKLDGRLQQYAWDGRKLRVVDALDHDSFFVAPGGHYSGLLRRSLRQLRQFFRTALAPQDVDSSYWRYMRWKCLQRSISSILQVHATQSMLLAVGVGAKRSLPSAAGLTWVLKDGLGRLGRLSYAATYGRIFDCHLKRVRFGTSVLFTASLGLETLTPLAPSHFLPLATLANVGKSIGLAAYLATTPAVHKTFALADNLADISAKGQAQTVVADNLGLALAMLIGAAVRRNDRLRASLPLALYPALAIFDVFAIHQELRAVPLRSLNKERLEMVTQAWLQDGKVPSASQISEKEHLLFPWIPGSNGPLLQMGPLALQVRDPRELKALLEAQSDQSYVFSVCQSQRPFGLHHIFPPMPRFILSLREGAQTQDVVQGLLQAGHLRILADGTRSKALDTESSLPVLGGSLLKMKGRRGEVGDEWPKWEEGLMQESGRLAQRDLGTFVEALRCSDWDTRRVLLAPSEQRSFSTISGGLC